MARLWSCGFEENSTTVEGTTVTGTANSVQTTTVRSGTYAAETNAAGAASYFKYQWTVGNLNQQMYYRVYINISAYPSAEDKVIWVDRTQTDGVVGIRMETNGVLRLYNEAPISPAQVGSDSSALSKNKWYRIEIFFDNTTDTSSVLTGYIDGVQFATGTIDTSRHSAQAILGFGSRNAVTATYFFDDIAINDTTGANQTGLPGVGQIIHLRPSAAGDNNAFTIQVGGTAGAANNYTRVQEVTPDDATSYNADATSGDIDDFVIDSAPSSIGASDTINVVMIGARFSTAVAASEASFRLRVKSQTGGTVASSAQITPTNTAWHTNQVVVPTNNYILVSYTDPQAGGSWTKALLNTAQIGYIITATNTNAAQFSTVWMLVDSTPVAVTATATKFLPIMGVGT